jgi:hypothetical protein
MPEALSPPKESPREELESQTWIGTPAGMHFRHCFVTSAPAA